MSLELGWFTPAQAREYIAGAKSSGLMAGEDELELTFDYKSQDVPRGFRPTPGHVDEPSAAPDPFIALVDEIAAATGSGREAVFAAISAVQDEHGGMIDATSALLLWASRSGMDIRAKAAGALATMLGEPQ